MSGASFLGDLTPKVLRRGGKEKREIGAGQAAADHIDKTTGTDSTQPGLQTSPQTAGGTEWDPTAPETGGRLARAFRNARTFKRNQTQAMPVMDSEEVKRVRRRYTAQQAGRGGRESTALTSDKLGGG